MQIDSLPRIFKYAAVIIAALALIPPALIARARSVKSTQPRIHLVPDMDNQPRFKAQQVNALFADQRAMRRPVPGTLAREDYQTDEHLYRGLVNGQWAAAFPKPVTEKVMRRGRERFAVYCAPCHGLDGYGRGVVAVRAEELEEATWVPPLSLHSDQVLQRPAGHLFNTITNGIRTMPAYGSQIQPDDRWAAAAYVHALQRSQRAAAEDVPAEIRDVMK